MLSKLNMQHLVGLLVLGLIVTCARPSFAQVSGVPGDGIPDLYYFSEAAEAPNGESRPAGRLLLDTDGSDFVAYVIV